MSETLPQAISFADYIATNQQADAAPPDFHELRTARSNVLIRERGAFLLQCNLYSMRRHQQQPVLYSEPDHLKPKLQASHTMSPVGPSNDIGGQHGFPRWADYHAFPQPHKRHDVRRLSLQAKRPDMGPGLVKVVELHPTALFIRSEFTNNADTPLTTSLGEHLYFTLPFETMSGLLVDHRPVDEALERRGALDDLMQGRPVFWPQGGKQSSIDFPDGRIVTLRAGASVRQFEHDNSTKFATVGAAAVGLLLWHRVGSESICFEPTVGLQDPARDPADQPPQSQLTLPPHASIYLTTTVGLE